jgi:molybdate transport system substrate-binding protein
LLAMLAGCAPPQNRLTVAAASNLTGVFGEIGREFRARTGIEVIYSFGSTAHLAIQIEHGAPFDVFVAADVENIDALKRKNLLLPGSRAIYGRGRLALWLPPARLPLARLEDVASLRQIAVANPSLAPYGAAAVETLQRLGLWQTVRDRIVYAANIVAARQYAESGNADAAFTAYSLVLNSGGKTIVVPEELHTPLEQGIAILRTSKRQKEARQFLTFVLGEQGRAFLQRYGYEQ